MKKSTLILLFIFVVCTYINAQVTAYYDCNFQGKQKVFYEGKYNLASSATWNNTISSLNIPYGWAATVYDNDNYTSVYTCYTTNQTCLADNNKNDIISSMIITQAVKFYTDCNYQGQSWLISVGNWNLYIIQARIGNDMISSIVVPKKVKITVYENADYSGASKTFGPGSYNCLDNVGWNDKITSLKISYSNETIVNDGN